ncbi:hypothetical protein CUJ84_pRLN1000564 (plasmid) [Rhizobium leguminosarum]|uniref:Uncharacterized protein n=1 Tax=Rhizobium leguminosarum TaxID=384 RepID=A0A2K9ZCQ2_RHILE|nr:hypothetical protein CUJ84_pRLN1000564 [Rhizobium leguminosarum]
MGLSAAPDVTRKPTYGTSLWTSAQPLMRSAQRARFL